MNINNKIYWYNFNKFQWKDIIEESWFKDIYRICAHCHVLRDHEDEKILDLMDNDKYLHCSLNDLSVYDRKIYVYSDPLNPVYYAGYSDLTNALLTFPLMRKLYPDVKWYVIGGNEYVYVTNIPYDKLLHIKEDDITNDESNNVYNSYIIVDLTRYSDPKRDMDKGIFYETNWMHPITYERIGHYLHCEFDHIDPLSYFIEDGYENIIKSSKHIDLYHVDKIEQKTEESNYMNVSEKPKEPLIVPKYWLNKIDQGYKLPIRIETTIEETIPQFLLAILDSIKKYNNNIKE